MEVNTFRPYTYTAVDGEVLPHIYYTNILLIVGAPLPHSDI